MRGGRSRTAPPLVIKAKNKDKMKNQFKKTYGVSGLIDWQAQIKAGKASLIVTFTGGGLTSYGVTPAQYTTENILFQKIIENSKEFKKGKIKLLRTIPLNPTADVNANTVTDLADVRKVVPKENLRAIEGVQNCSDARIWLKEHKNVSVVGKSKQEIVEIAAANGVSFPNLMK